MVLSSKYNCLAGRGVGMRLALAACAALLAPATATAGTWQTLVTPPPAPDILDKNGNDLGPGGAGAPLLMTDGSIIVQNSGGGGADGRIMKLTPDNTGSYVNGTWSFIARLPYDPIANAQAVLPDGRVLVEGGEYTGPSPQFLLTNKGAIYDPVKDKWTSVKGPKFFKDLYPPRRQFAPHPIGDSASTVLADGTFMLDDKMSRQAALFNAKTLTWTPTGGKTKSDMTDEEGLTLLPNGKVLTVDCYTDYLFGLINTYPTDPTASEIYDPATQKWSYGGSTIKSLTDPSLFEIGPAVLRPDGTVFALGDFGNSSIYNSSAGTWSKGPTLPTTRGVQYTSEDGPGALLPNGNVVVAASPASGSGYSSPPVAFFEFDGTKFNAEPTIPNAGGDTSYSMGLIVLPTGQILSVDSTKDVEIYTSNDGSHNKAWEPVIGSAPSSVTRGSTYPISGVLFNGMSQASAFGDENQNATNYPLVRITNNATKHVFYARTHDHSSMAVASPATVSTMFDAPAGMETGASSLVVVANGIASQPVNVTVQ
jgi:hypothetical protein